MNDTTLSRRTLLRAGAGAALAGAAPGALEARAQTSAPAPRTAPAKPLLISHRGASALRPEHTLASYARAIEDGADFVEPDLVATKDGVLIARHENNIADTTDIATRPEFAGRKATRTIDGKDVTGWFTEDFTLAEIKSLRAVERLPVEMRGESHRYDGQFQLLTLAEIADFVGAEAAARGRTIGLIPELKHSTYFRGIGLPLEERFLAAVADSAILQNAPVIVQSFEVSNLQWLRPRIAGQSNIELLQLTVPMDVRPVDLAQSGEGMTYAQMHSPEGLARLRDYADWVSPILQSIIPFGTMDGKPGPLGTPTALVRDAHSAGLKVSTWTFRPENAFLPTDYRGEGGEAARHDEGSVRMMQAYIATGIDSFFTDDPALGRRAIDTMPKG
ncbi:MAG: glycerophosphodiester phosphodiesterase family protein [Pseudomonadota bacterium]|nr:glycerophosphodiester phosphodiesterase family protein [Pseudomonadota bacterium]